jgi:hypothetical protein
MLSIVVSLVAAVAVSALFKLTFIKSWAGVIVPGAIAMIAVMALLFRRAAHRLEPLMKQVERHLAGGRRELAMKTMRDGLPLGRWHPLLPGQIHAQLGIMDYVAGEFDDAERELSRASRWPWMSRAYLGCVYFKKRDGKNMRAAFNTAVKVGAKEGISWTLYAWCLMAQGAREEAVALLERGLKKLPGDHRLQTNLELAREGKKLKTAPYGEQWTRFGLDSAGPAPVAVGGREVPKFMRGHNPRPGFRQRPRRK